MQEEAEEEAAEAEEEEEADRQGCVPSAARGQAADRCDSGEAGNHPESELLQLRRIFII